MAIATAMEVNWRDTVDATNKIGLSDTLNNLGADVFDSVDFCLGFENPALKLTKESDGYPKSTDPDANNVAYYISNTIGYSLTGVNNPNGAYYRTLLFAVRSSWSWGWDTHLRNDDTYVRIVTKLDLSKNKAYLTTNETAKDECVQHGTPTYIVKESLEGTTSNGNFYIGNTMYRIVCGNIYKTDNGYYVKFPYYIDPLYDNFNANYGEGALANLNYDSSSSKRFSAAPAMFNKEGWIISLSNSGQGNYYMPSYNETEIEVPPDANNSNLKLFGTYTRNSSFYWRVSYEMSVEYWLWIMASYGLMFEWNGTDYKPIITDGYLQGYTDNLSMPSDIDNWTDISGHTIPSTPPGGGGDIQDSEINMPLTQLATGAGFVDYYKINTTYNGNATATAAEISAALSRFDISQIGKDLLRNLISYKVFAMFNSTGDSYKQITIGGNGLEDENNNQLKGVQVDQMRPITINPITIPKLYNDFRDYAPYTKIEMYVPCCGWFPLPPWCIGKTVTGAIFIDLYNGTCKAVILASQTVVAEVGGSVSYDVPFVAESVGAKTSAVISSALSTAASAAATYAMPNAGTAIATAASAANLATAINGNYTELKGVLGDGSGINGLTEVYIKVSRPKSPTGTTAIPDSYKKEYGVPTFKEMTLAAGDGFTQVSNPVITGTMTATEKQMIADGLRHGLIL